MSPERYIVTSTPIFGLTASTLGTVTEQRLAEHQAADGAPGRRCYHVRVDDLTRWNPVTGVHIFLLSVEAPDASDELDASSPLSWRNEPNPQPKTIGYHAECDLCYVIKEPREVRLSPLIVGQVPSIYAGPFKIAVTLQARGIEADLNPLRVEISWNGEWSDHREEMKHHLVVKTISSPTGARNP